MEQVSPEDNGDNMHDEGVVCAECGGTPEDVLILTCEHNLCLPCAAKNLHNSQQRQTNSKTSFQVSSQEFLQALFRV